MKIGSTTMTKSDFVYPPVYYKEKEPSSGEKVKKMREKTWGRYEDEIGNALDKLTKKPKSEWPELLKEK